MQASLLSISRLTVINWIIRRTSHFDQGPKQNSWMANVSLRMSLLLLIICTHCALRGLATCSHAVIEHWNWKHRMPRGLLFIISLYVVQISQDMASVSLETCLPCSIQACCCVCVIRNAGQKYPHWILYTPEKSDSSRLETKMSDWFILNKITATCDRKQIKPVSNSSHLERNNLNRLSLKLFWDQHVSFNQCRHIMARKSPCDYLKALYCGILHSTPKALWHFVWLHKSTWHCVHVSQWWMMYPSHQQHFQVNTESLVRALNRYFYKSTKALIILCYRFNHLHVIQFIL